MFPDIGRTFWPKKGSAVFWYNLFQNGEGDVRTRHAACPVLAGTKWGIILMSYNTLQKADLLAALPFDENKFDCLISVAVTTYLSKCFPK